ncbi:MAG: acyl-CoA dehydrogenase [Pelagibacterales bacterium]|nr:acyl-CoA dehydrogenase [Pelagibacterales bacterium]PPR15840.1 MAG: 3-methylmercaptopropionyl-CoA dehydrogenase [Alphaproteobacteria bacterium MarineAlpha9_Bin3]|tara:strand:- start:3260 stop:5044 length:1785 start_codon:yes stop_codon:yes gene_type:complete
MQEYNAPIEDILFVLNNINSKVENNSDEYSDPDLRKQIFEEAGKFASNILAPLNSIGDKEGITLENGVVRMPQGFKEAYSQYIEGGWSSVAGSKDFGGQEMPWNIVGGLNEIWHAANMSFSLNMLLTQGAIEVIEAYGTNEQKKKYLPKMISGEWSGTMNLTEPQAGSDLALLKSKAIPNRDNYKLYGNKIYITHGDQDMNDNIVHLVLARLPDAPEGSKGISLFISPKNLINEEGEISEKNDVRVVSIEHKLGTNASPTCVLAYGDNDGADAELIGEKHGGLKAMFTMMNNARLNVGIQGVSIAERAYQQALNFSFSREQGNSIDNSQEGTVAIIDHPDVKRMLMDMRSRIEAMRALSLFTANELDLSKNALSAKDKNKAQENLDLLTPIVKGWCTDQGVLIASTGVQIHGGMGFIEETGAAQHYRDARILPIYEGTNGIQALDLLRRKLTLDNGNVFKRFLNDMRKDAKECINSEKDKLIEIGDKVIFAINTLENTADDLLNMWKDNKRNAASGATPFLDMCGNIFGAWIMAKSAIKAYHLLEETDGDKFLNEKIETAYFYANTILETSLSLKNVVINTHKNLDSIFMNMKN